MKIEGNVIKLRGAETTIDVDAPLRIKDGASFVDVRNYIAPVFQYENLVVKNNSGTPNSQIDVSWDSLYIGPIHSTTYTQTLNIESDTDWDSGDHTDEPPDGFVFVHAFAKADGTEVCKFSLSATTPTLPTGYIYSRAISYVRNTSGHFNVFYQKNNLRSISFLAILTAGASATPAAIDISTYIPHVMAREITLNVSIDTTGGVGASLTIMPIDNASVFSANFYTDSYSRVSQMTPVYSNNIYYSILAGTASIQIVGCTLNI